MLEAYAKGVSEKGNDDSEMSQDSSSDKEEEPDCKIKTDKCLNSLTIQALMLLVIMYSLFSDDVRICFFDPSADEVFIYLTAFSMAAFVVEIILTSFIKPEYICSFYFWLDVIATLSLIFDIEPISPFSQDNGDD